MKLGKNYFEELTSFLAVEKDLQLITEKLMTNQKLMKLLFYTQKDCLKGKDLTIQEIYSMINHQLKIVPYIPIDESCPIVVIITMGAFKPNKKNPQFRDSTIRFDILCHPDHWSLGDFALRPYKIAGEIDSMLSNKKLTGIGETQFMGGDRITMNQQLMGLTLLYSVTHSIEDKK